MPNSNRPKNPSILIVDDSTVDLRLLMEMMASRSMRVNVAFNGKDGYQKATLARPDLILLDVVMPGIDGFATCRLLKSDKRTRHIPVIFLSAASEVDKRIEGLTLGGVDYIGKPFSEEEVIARVEIHLNLVRQKSLAPAALKDSEVDAALSQGVSPANAVLIRAATEHLRRHLKNPPAPELLARIVGTNEKRLNQAFQAGFALPVFAWLREERLRQARELLASTEASMASIADHLGYSNQANFAKAFQERFSCSPSNLRQQQQLLRSQQAAARLALC